MQGARSRATKGLAARARVIVLAVSGATAIGGCVGTVPFGPPPPRQAAPGPCAAPAIAPALEEPRFLPTVAGELTLVRAEGDPRLSAEGGILAAWSADAELVAFSDRGAVTVWQGSDGRLVDLVRCTPRDLSANDIALSPDGRWVVVSGLLRDPYEGSGDRPTTCIVDRRSATARLIAGETRDPEFSADGTAVRGADRKIDLGSEKVEALAAPHARRGYTTGTLALSHDGRLVARARACKAVPTDSGAEGTPTELGEHLLELSERATGKVLWRVPNRCESWRFSPDDRYLEKTPNRYGDEVVDVRTGARLRFPGGLLPIAPDGERVVVLTPTGPELWSPDPFGPIVGGGRPRRAVARSRDGTVVAAIARDDELVVERDGRCVPLGARATFSSGVALSPDGQELYAGLGGGNVTRFRVWRTDTGAMTGALDVTRPVGVYPMPAAGRVGFEAEGGIRIYDAHTGAPVGVARAPRTRYTPFKENRSWPVRDHAGPRPDRLASFVAATADGRHLLGTTGLEHPTVTIWDLEDPPAVIDLPVADRIEAVALSPDERFVAAGDGRGALSLWTRAGRPVPVAARHDTKPLALAFSPGGDRLAAAFDDGIVEIIDTASGRTTGTVTLPSQRATFLWWSPDGRRLVIDTTRRLRFEVARGRSRTLKRSSVVAPAEGM